MKAMNLANTAIRGGNLLTLAGLLVLGSAHAQVIYDSSFGLPPLDQFVRIVSPADHATFFTPVDIPIFAYAREENAGYEEAVVYTNVDFFYSGTNSLASFTNVLLGPGVCLNTTNATALPTFPTMPRFEPRLAAMFSLVWTNPLVGSYALTAVAHGLESFQPGNVVSLSRTSAPVKITVISSLTNLNPTEVVSITAVDPIAIASTNALWIWPGLTNATPGWNNWPPAHWGYTTNWGPKNGLFSVRRFGDVSSSLTVNYNIGGTASNGFDYVTLPGSVTVPAGAGFALIPVVPMDNHITNLVKSVVLSLAAVTNSPPGYGVGIPRQAEVLILDYWSRPRPFLLPDTTFYFNRTNCPDGAWFSVENSTDLQKWTPVSTNQVVHGSIDFLDPAAPGNPSGFYRYVPLTNAPAF